MRWDLVRGGHQTYIEHTRFLGCNHDYRVILHDDGSTNSLKLPLVSYSTDEGVTCATVGAWVLLEAGEQRGVRRSGRALTPNVRNAELLA